MYPRISACQWKAEKKKNKVQKGQERENNLRSRKRQQHLLPQSQTRPHQALSAQQPDHPVAQSADTQPPRVADMLGGTEYVADVPTGGPLCLAAPEVCWIELADDA